MKEFYSVIKAKVEAGQYKLNEMIEELQLAYSKNYITLEQHEELVELAKTSVDENYVENKYATPYDLNQDVVISSHDLSIVDLYEMVLISSTPTQRAKMVVGRSISDSYVRLIIRGVRTFESVPEPMKQEVADKLIEMGREDLVTEIQYKPIDPSFSVEG